MSQPAELESVLGHVFQDARHLELALTHSSLAYEEQTGRSGAHSISAGAGPEGTHDNEQLEFLGDAVLGLISAAFLLNAYPDLNEGDLSRIRHQLISRKHLGKVGAHMSLGTFLRLGRGEERSGGRQKPVLLANAVEAVIAALYLDGGLPAASTFIERWIIRPFVDELRAELDAGDAMGDHKSALQVWLQAQKAGSPNYSVKAESGPDHRKRFLVEVEFADADGKQTTAHGTGSTKKKAEQEAARKAYQQLRQSAAAQEEPAPSMKAAASAPNGMKAAAPRQRQSAAKVKAAG